MSTDNVNSVPEEQFNTQNVENAASAQIKPEPKKVETNAEQASSDFSSENAAVAANAKDFELEKEGEIESEEVSEVLTNYEGMSKSELVEAFKNELATKPVQSIRKDVDAIKNIFYKHLCQEQEVYKKAYIDAGKDIAQYVAPVDKDEIEFKSVFNSYKIKRSEYIRSLEGEKENNYKIKLELIEKLKELIDRKENIGRSFQEFKEIQQKWRETGPVPLAYNKDIWETYNHHVENFYDLMKINKELRDLDYKKNLEVKTDLCEKAEQLLSETSAVAAFNKLQKYHEQWRDAGPVAPELRDEIWNRFKEITSKINKQHQAYFENQKEEQKKNLDAKTALCEQTEALAAAEYKTNKEWNDAMKKFVELQAKWKTIGFASKKENTKIYERFRKAGDDFFEKKRDFYKEFKKLMDENYQKKVALCEKAESLADSTDWKKTADDLMNLQKQWKEIGPVTRKFSNELWERFRGACDNFFTNRKNANKEQNASFEENLKQKEALISEINAFAKNDDEQKNLDALKNFQRRWAEIGFVPMKEKERIQNEYKTAINNISKLLNISEKERKLVKFKSRIESMQSGDNKGQTRALRTERDKMLQQIRQIESDIAVWENNIGFFSKSKNADSLIADVKRKIDRAREEVKTIEEKIKLLDESTDNKQ